MLTAARSLVLNHEAGKPMPRIPTLSPLYQYGVEIRQGQIIMVAGRSGSQKSGFAMWLAKEWDLPTLYFSGDMSAFTASSRLASSITSKTTEDIERAMAKGGPERNEILAALAGSKMQFAFGSPITWRSIDEELDAFVELHNAYPQVIILDNLMDFEGGAESDYTAQMAVMASVTEMARDTGATVLIMHHASDKSWDAKNDPFSPPSRQEVKGGLSEKPELSLSVALNPNDLRFNIAVIKNRSGAQDPTARRWVTIQCKPEVTQFAPLKH